MKKLNDRIGYIIGTVLVLLIGLGVVAALSIGILKIWLYFFQVIRLVF